MRPFVFLSCCFSIFISFFIPCIFLSSFQTVSSLSSFMYSSCSFLPSFLYCLSIYSLYSCSSFLPSFLCLYLSCVLLSVLSFLVSSLSFSSSVISFFLLSFSPNPTRQTKKIQHNIKKCRKVPHPLTAVLLANELIRWRNLKCRRPREMRSHDRCAFVANIVALLWYSALEIPSMTRPCDAFCLRRTP